VADAPEFRRPVYAVYPQASAQEALFQLVLGGLRAIAKTEAAESEN